MKKMKNTALFLSLLLSVSVIGQTIKLEDIYIRDPYILTADGQYYLYRTVTEINMDGKQIGGVEVFSSKDLRNWSGPEKVFTVPDNN